MSLTPLGPIRPGDPAGVRRRRATEDFDDLSLDPASPSYFLKRVNGTNPAAGGNSSLRRVRRGLPPNELPGDYQSVRLANGADGEASWPATSTEVTPTPTKTGLAALALDRYRDVAIVHAPAREAWRRRSSPLRAKPVPVRGGRFAADEANGAAARARDLRATASTRPSTTRGSSSAIRAARPREDPAGRRGLRHLRPHRQHHRGVEGAGQRGGGGGHRRRVRGHHRGAGGAEPEGSTPSGGSPVEGSACGVRERFRATRSGST